MSARDKKLLYHLTPLANVASITEHGLLSRAELRRRAFAHADVADPQIVRRRADLALEETVPFHFVAKSPFAYRVARRPRAGPLVLLCVRRALARRRGYLVIPEHPLSGRGEARLLAWDDGIGEIAWDRLDAGGDWRTDSSLRCALMAEAVSPEAVPIADVAVAFVTSRAVCDEVRALLTPVAGTLVIENEWMFPPVAR